MPLGPRREWLRTNQPPISAGSDLARVTLALVAGVVAFWQFNAQWQLQNEAAAKAAYREFLKISMDNPKYSRPDLLGREFTALEYEQYFWYANLMTQTFEQVFQFVPDIDNWSAIAREQVRLHCGFYSGGDYTPDLHSDRMNAVVREVLDTLPENECYRVGFKPGPAQD